MYVTRLYRFIVPENSAVPLPGGVLTDVFIPRTKVYGCCFLLRPVMLSSTRRSPCVTTSEELVPLGSADVDEVRSSHFRFLPPTARPPEQHLASHLFRIAFRALSYRALSPRGAVKFATNRGVPNINSSVSGISPSPTRR